MTSYLNNLNSNSKSGKIFIKLFKNLLNSLLIMDDEIDFGTFLGTFF